MKYRVVVYYRVFNVAYLDENKANLIVNDYAHKGETVQRIFVIIENDKVLPLQINTDSDGYLHFDNVQHALDEIKLLEEI